MNKKAIALLTVIIVIIGIIALIAYQINSENNQVITVTYTTHPMPKPTIGGLTILHMLQILL